MQFFSSCADFSSSFLVTYFLASAVVSAPLLGWFPRERSYLWPREVVEWFTEPTGKFPRNENFLCTAGMVGYLFLPTHWFPSRVDYLYPYETAGRYWNPLVDFLVGRVFLCTPWRVGCVLAHTDKFFSCGSFLPFPRTAGWLLASPDEFPSEVSY